MPESITAPNSSHIPQAIGALLATGWKLRKAPASGRLNRNGQRIILRSSGREVRVRLFVYKVTGSSRQRPDERRIEITSTYQKGLPHDRAYRDVVLGYEPDRGVFVGVDPRRIAYGGPTGNASSFFDQMGLTQSEANEILILQRGARLFAGRVEFHAFFLRPRLSEYVFNREAIHAGTYAGDGPYSGPIRLRPGRVRMSAEKGALKGDVVVLSGPRVGRRWRRVSAWLVRDYESGAIGTRRRRRITPEEFEDLRRRSEANGRLGEEFVLKRERRALRVAGRGDLAARVRRVSLESVGEGYDIRSYRPDGQETFIEVKATTGTGQTFEMTDNEWRTAVAHRQKYYIHYVTRVRSDPKVKILQNLEDLEADGMILRTASGWRVRVR